MALKQIKSTIVEMEPRIRGEAGNPLSTDLSISGRHLIIASQSLRCDASIAVCSKLPARLFKAALFTIQLFWNS